MMLGFVVTPSTTPCASHFAISRTSAESTKILTNHLPLMCPTSRSGAQLSPGPRFLRKKSLDLSLKNSPMQTLSLHFFRSVTLPVQVNRPHVRQARSPNQINPQNDAHADFQPIVGSRFDAPISTDIERWISSRDTTTRQFPFQRSRMPLSPARGPSLTRTRWPAVRYGCGSACSPYSKLFISASISSSGIAAGFPPNP